MKFKKFAFSLFLFLGALLVISSSTYASTTTGITYHLDQDYMYLGSTSSSYDPTTHRFELSGVMNDLGGYLDVDLKDAPDYNLTSRYTFYIEDFHTGNIVYTSQVAFGFSAEPDSQNEDWLIIKDIHGQSIDSLFVRTQDAFLIYWEIEETDSTPVFDGQTVFVTTIDNPIPVQTITSYISAYDETDGDVSHMIELVDSARDLAIFFYVSMTNAGVSFTPNLTTLEYIDHYDNDTLSISDGMDTMTRSYFEDMWIGGSSIFYHDNITTLLPTETDINWSLAYYVSDSNGNYAALEVIVLVKDVLGPTWNEAKDNVSVSYTETFNIENYKSQLEASDNYYDTSDLTITVDSNTYTANKTTPGSYEVVYKILDPSNNYTLAPVTVNVYDDVKPVFSGPTVISKSSTQAMTISQIKSQLSANDIIDGNLTSNIQVVSDDYTGNGNVVGSYNIQFSVSDSSGNIAYHTISIEIYDNLPPIFYVKDGYFVSVVQSVHLTQQDFIDILQITGQISVSGTGGIEVYTLLNEYESNESTPGIYALSFRTVSQSGDESVYNMAVEVMEDTENPVDVIEDEDSSTLSQFWDDNKTYIIGGLIIISFGGFVFIISKKTKKHMPKKKGYKKVRK